MRNSSCIVFFHRRTIVTICTPLCIAFDLIMVMIIISIRFPQNINKVYLREEKKKRAPIIYFTHTGVSSCATLEDAPNYVCVLCRKCFKLVLLHFCGLPSLLHFSIVLHKCAQANIQCRHSILWKRCSET